MQLPRLGRGPGGHLSGHLSTTAYPREPQVTFISIPTGHSESYLAACLQNSHDSEIQGSPVTLVCATHIPTGDRVTLGTI